MTTDHTAAWVQFDPEADLMPTETIYDVVGPFMPGTRVWERATGREGIVAGFARSTEAHEHWTAEHGTPVSCVYGEGCDALVDAEGPLIRWLDQDPADESLTWFCGQGSGALRTADQTA